MMRTYFGWTIFVELKYTDFIFKEIYLTFFYQNKNCGPWLLTAKQHHRNHSLLSLIDQEGRVLRAPPAGRHLITHQNNFRTWPVMGYFSKKSQLWKNQHLNLKHIFLSLANCVFFNCMLIPYWNNVECLLPLALLQKRTCLRAVKCTHYTERGTNILLPVWCCSAWQGWAIIKVLSFRWSWSLSYRRLSKDLNSKVSDAAEEYVQHVHICVNTQLLLIILILVAFLLMWNQHHFMDHQFDIILRTGFFIYI